MVCDPDVRLEVWKVAWPLALSVLIPSVAVHSLKVTVPVGMPEPGATAVTKAVKVTAWPAAAGLSDEVSVVLVDALLTVWLVIDEVLEAKVVSPLYTAEMAWEPAVSVDAVKVAVPPLSVAVPIVLVPSLNVTMPLGVPVPGGKAATVTVKVT